MNTPGRSRLLPLYLNQLIATLLLSVIQLPFATSPNISPASRDKIWASLRAIILTTTVHLSKTLEEVRKQTCGNWERRAFFFPNFYKGKSWKPRQCVCVCVCVCCVHVCSQMFKTEHFHTMFMLVLSEPKTQEPITVGNRSLQKAQGLIS